MPGKVTFIDYQEPTFVTVSKYIESIRLIKEFNEKRFEALSYTGNPPSISNGYTDDNGKIELLKDIGCFGRGPKIGIIHISVTYDESGNKIPEFWQFDIFGKGYTETFKILAGLIAEKFHADICLSLRYMSPLDSLPSRYNTDA